MNDNFTIDDFIETTTTTITTTTIDYSSSLDNIQNLLIVNICFIMFLSGVVISVAFFNYLKC